MLSFRLVRFIEAHADRITDRVVHQIRRDTKLFELGKLPEPELRERSREILMNLGSWLISKEDDLAYRYEDLGRKRYRERVPLHEVVHGLHIIREKMIEYIHDEGFGQTPLEVYAEDELHRSADRIFDSMVFYVIRGYERAFREGPRRAASGAPELPLPI